MKLKSLIIGLCISLCTSVFAANQHIHPKATDNNTKQAADKLTYPAYCEIEVINNSYDNVRVTGVFDDGTILPPFNVYSFESPHYISLFYYGYCHAGMNIYVDTWSGYRIYAAYTPVHTSVKVYPYLAKQLKVEAKPR